MTIKHNSLEQRLNAVKIGEPIPKPPRHDEMNFPYSQLNPSEFKPMSYRQFFISEGYKLFNVMSTSILYGYGLKALFSADWSIIGVLGVGFLLNHALTISIKLLKK